MQEAQLPLHLITPPHLVDELALEGTNLWVQLREGGMEGEREGGRDGGKGEGGREGGRGGGWEEGETVVCRQGVLTRVPSTTIEHWPQLTSLN